MYQAVFLDADGTLDASSRVQGAASLTITAESSFERHHNFNDVWRHRNGHQLLSMTIFIIVIIIGRHRHPHFFIIFSINYSSK